MFINSKSGFCPFNPDVIDPMNLKPYVPLQQLTEDMPICTPAIDLHSATESSSGFFPAKDATVRTKKPPTKKRRYLSYVVSGNAITEDSMVDAIIQHESSKTQKGSAAKCTSDKSAPKPSSSGTFKPNNLQACRSEDFDSDASDTAINVCCVSNLFTPQKERKSSSLIFVKQVECSNREHIAHLVYCTKVRVVRRGDNFHALIVIKLNKKNVL